MSRLPEVIRYTLTMFGVLLEIDGEHRLITTGPSTTDPYRNLDGTPDPWWKVSNRPDLFDFLWSLWKTGLPIDGVPVRELIARDYRVPVQAPFQVVKCNGVTVAESEFARNDEYLQGGDRTVKTGQDAASAVTPYTKAGDLTNPAETFSKAMTPGHLFTDGGKAGIRADSGAGKVTPWDVPEPEFGIVSTTGGVIVAFFIGNDMSSRSLEGLTPLELGNAKEYELAAGVSRWITVPRDALAYWKTLTLRSWVERAGKLVFPAEVGKMASTQVRRPPQELVNNVFRQGPFLSLVFQMTGTGICPKSGDEFTLQPRDVIIIESPQLGTFRSTVTVIDWPENRQFVPHVPTNA